MQELRTAPRQRRSQQSIDAILDAAERLIHDHGQVSFTAAELAAGAQMSIGRVYYWFPDIHAIVSALVERTVERMVAVFSEALESQKSASTPMLLQGVVGVLCDHIDRNPATVALCLTGGSNPYGDALFASMADVAAMVVRDRVVDITDAEVEVVSRTAVGITLGMLHDYTHVGDRKVFLRQELVYVLSAWLVARYPDSSDRAWSDPEYPIRPSRRPRSGPGERLTGQVWPALAPDQPPAAVPEPGA